MKRCSRCGVEKLESEFHKDTHNRTGRAAACRVCRNREKDRERKRTYRAAHREKDRERKRTFRAAHPERIRVANMLSGMRRRSRKFGYLLDAAYFTPERIRALVAATPTCPCCGTPWRTPGTGFGNGSPTIDKIVPKLGYVPGNVALLCQRCNAIKNDCTDPAELRRVAAWMEKVLPKKEE